METDKRVSLWACFHIQSFKDALPALADGFQQRLLFGPRKKLPWWRRQRGRLQPVAACLQQHTHIQTVITLLEEGAGSLKQRNSLLFK